MNAHHRLPAVLCGILAWLALSSPAALACSVCFGDPDSPLTKGAMMGVLVMVGVVGFVLLCIAGTGVFWMHRGRQIARFGSPSGPQAKP